MEVEQTWEENRMDVGWKSDECGDGCGMKVKWKLEGTSLDYDATIGDCSG